MPLQLNNHCARFGHRPGQAHWIADTYFVRNCRRCFYSEAGRVLLNRSTGEIKLQVQCRYDPLAMMTASASAGEPSSSMELSSNERSNDTTRTGSSDATTRTSQSNVDGENSQKKDDEGGNP